MAGTGRARRPTRRLYAAEPGARRRDGTRRASSLEAASLRWRSVDLASARLTVEASKTDAAAGLIADLNPELVGLLKLHRIAARFTGPDDLVFATSTGREKGRSSIARQVLGPALERANKARAKTGRPPIARATCHDCGGRSVPSRVRGGVQSSRGDGGARTHERFAQPEVYGKVVAGATTGLGEGMAKLVRGPEWAPNGH